MIRISLVVLWMFFAVLCVLFGSVLVVTRLAG